ncbi:helix-turn-helix transcriptional regulator [Prevotella sp. OH937_COT-195]|uniref:helix-turn-helix transcriptional regulator n=1 Tax=Prevotella sp. OH937_COT-195 TaxID=2491051 RepID=UPI000F645E68|nr:WYL domain-containing protein [Prevotella sp. OH937_COT-195]RRD01926.1 WYL domain-containing protein [Prevotella sp. OH937_COT-195]
MRHDKLERELGLLLLLAENRGYTLEQICERMEMGHRNFYYYLEFFRNCGFIVEKRNGIYSIDRQSPFFMRLQERIDFTEDEVLTMRRLLEASTKHDAVATNLMKKLDRFYDFNILADNQLRENVAHNVSALYKAIKFKRMAVLHNYHSPHSRTEKDRLVEPFTLLNNNNEVRCYEPESQMNKTFKVSRIGEVEILDDGWLNEKRHRTVHTDIFMFSDEEQKTVEMLLGSLSYNIIIEEYSGASAYIEKASGQQWLLCLPVCSYTGIGRFVLGLYDDIEVKGDDGFKEYLHKKIAKMQSY